MKILHFIMGKANKDRANGVNQVIYGMVKYLVRLGVDITVVGKASNAKIQGETVTYPDFSVVVYSKAGAAFWKRLAHDIQSHDIVHLHGVYNILNIIVGWMCLYYKTPYIVTLHDGLSPERMRKRFVLKWLFSQLLQKSFLRHARLLHVLTREEQTTAIRFVGDHDTVVIENGIDHEDYPKDSPRRERPDTAPIVFGYLGRLSPEKNLPALVAAFQRFANARAPSDRPVTLHLAGPENDQIQTALQADNLIHFVGPKFGTDKVAFLTSLDWFVHPALCDVFSIAAMEALAAGTPLIISRLADASYYARHDAFVMCEPTVAGLTDALIQASSLAVDPDIYRQRGAELIDTTFNWQTAAARMRSTYEKVMHD